MDVVLPEEFQQAGRFLPAVIPKTAVAIPLPFCSLVKDLIDGRVVEPWRQGCSEAVLHAVHRP